eukprot:XP_014623701.1 uncharacterized protein LOC100812621 isoform X2 [Glycine max]
MKDFPSKRGDKGWESFDYTLERDCLSFMYYWQSREHRNPSEQRTSALEQGLGVAEMEAARNVILEELEGKGVSEKKIQKQTVSLMAASFRWILQLHKDVPKAARFYSEGLDFSINVCSLRWAELQSGSLKVALVHSPNEQQQATQKGYSSLLSFTVNDMNNTVTKLMALGAELDGPIKYEVHGKGEDLLRESGIPYAIVRPCALTEEPAGANLILDQGDNITKYQEKVASKSKKKSNNLACIQAKDRTTGRTEIASCVKVVEIRVGAHIYPQNPVLHIGSPFNLSIKGLSDTVSGQWFTTNGSVISVDTLSGMAKAIGEGCAQVSFHYGRLKLQTTITVLKGNYIFVDAPKETLTNVPFPSK